MTSELKPCPFCGGEAKLVLFHIKPTNAPELKQWSIVHKCEAMESATFSNECEAEAIEAWNTRAERTCRNVGHEHGYRRFFVCSECEWKHGDGTPNYCPGCGAKVVE